MAVIVAGTMAMALALSLSVSESVSGPSMLLSVAQALACALRREALAKVAETLAEARV